MATIYVKAVEPCIFEDGLGNVVDMSHTEFYGKKRWTGIDPETGEEVEKDRKANPEKVFEVVDSKYWLELITGKRLVQVEKPKAVKRGKTGPQEEADEESLN